VVEREPVRDPAAAVVAGDEEARWPRPLISAAMSAAIARLLCCAWSASGVAAGSGLVESP
jgi:hypothetical protein